MARQHYYRRLHRAHNSTRRKHYSSADVQLVKDIVHKASYIYLINRSCRLDSTLLCSLSFILHTLSWCQISGKIQSEFYSDPNSHIAFQEDLKYSDFFRDHLPQHIGDVRREFIFYGLEIGLEKADFNRTTSTCTTELNTE